MKILRLTIILNLTFLNIFGQEYFSFIDTNSIWRDLRVDCAHGPSYLYNAQYDGEYFLRGDTTIGKVYSKLYFTGNRYYSLYDHGITANDTNFYCNLYVGGLREDSLKHVYHINTVGFERELFDFNLNVGDTIPGTVNPGPSYTYVTFIDSVYVFDRYRKRINFNWDVPLIEGIGRGYGILGINKTTSSLFCNFDRTKIYYYKNSKAYRFTNTGHPEDSLATLIGCHAIFAGVSEISRNSGINVYPNPISDFVSVEFPRNSNINNGHITIMDNIGHIILKQKINSNIIKVDLSILSEGIYFLNVFGIRENDTVIKLVKIKS